MESGTNDFLISDIATLIAITFGNTAEAKVTLEQSFELQQRLVIKQNRRRHPKILVGFI